MADAKTKQTPGKKCKRSHPGQPAFKPTKALREQVETLAGLGIKREDICLMVINPYTEKPITNKTLSAAFKDELRSGWVNANAKVVKSLFEKATGDGPASVTACIWWTKARMGWSELQKHEVVTKTVETMTEAELVEFLGGEPDNEELRDLASQTPAGHA